MGETHLLLREIHQVGAGTRERLLFQALCPTFPADRIWLAGLSRATRDFRFVRHHPRMAQLLVCFRGTGRVWVEDAWQPCGPGRAYLTPVGQFHAYQAGPRWEVGWIIYEPEAAFPALAAPRLLEVDPLPLERILEGMCQEAAGVADPAFLERWGGLLHRHVQRLASAERPSRLGNLWREVQAKPAAAWTLPGLARRAGMGPEQLRRVCRIETGRSPMQHLTHLRMEAAASLLARERKIEEIASLVGYANAFAFSTAFRRHLGQPPSRFRGTARGTE